MKAPSTARRHLPKYDIKGIYTKSLLSVGFGEGLVRWCLLVGKSLPGKSVSSSIAVRFVGGVGEVYEFC